MIKVKDFLKHGKIKDIGKRQIIKYRYLYEKIECEMIKDPNDRQNDDEFIYWISREYNHIEMNDPEITYKDKKKFHRECKIKNIPYDDDISLLKKINSIIAIDEEIEINKSTSMSNVIINTEKNIEVKNDVESIKSINALEKVYEEEKNLYIKNLKSFDIQKDLEWNIKRLDDLD